MLYHLPVEYILVHKPIDSLSYSFTIKGTEKNYSSFEECMDEVIRMLREEKLNEILK